MISILVNADTRPQAGEAQALFNGVVSRDFLVDGVISYQKFFSGFETETILFIDDHNPVDLGTLEALREICDKVILSKHSKKYRGRDPFGPFNDINYLQTFGLARGEFIAHFDQDTGAFTKGKEQVEALIRPVIENEVKFVCYPSEHSPRCVDDPTFQNHIWASTRFFFCRKETINLTELEEAIWEPQTLYAKYGQPARVCPWTEHFLGQAAGYSVLYPKLSSDLLIFPWHKYEKGILAKLNSLHYDEIGMRLIAAGAHSYHGVEANRLILE